MSKDHRFMSLTWGFSLSFSRFRILLLFFAAVLNVLSSNNSFANAPFISFKVADETKEAIQNPVLSKVEVGFDGSYRIGDWVSIRLFFDTEQINEWMVALTLPDADGNSITHYQVDYFSKGKASRFPNVTFRVQASRKPLNFKIGLIHVSRNQKEIFKEKNPELNYYYELSKSAPSIEYQWTDSGNSSIPSTKMAWLEIGPSLGLKNVIASTLKDEALAPGLVRVPDFGDLHGNNDFFDSFSGMTLNTRIAGFKVDRNIYSYKSEASAIADWVRSGGMLFLNLQYSELNLEHGGTSDLIEIWNYLLPGKLTTKSKQHTNFTLWENFLGTDEPLIINEQLRRNPPLIPVLENINGKVLLADGDTPLVIEHQLGLGRVVTCLVDLNAEPWRNWKKRDELLQRLIPWHITTDAEAKFASSSSSLRLGYDDMAGQFVTALGTFPSVRQTPFWVLMGGALVFGVVWYFIQSTLLKTWSAVARLVIAAFVLTSSTVGFAVLVGAFNGEVKLLANSAQVVDYNATQGEYQGQSWLSVMSNTARKIDLAATVNTASNTVNTTGKEHPKQQLEWLGLPGKGWGGLDAPLATWTQGSEPYQIDSHSATVTGLTLSPDLTKSFHERWRQPAEPAPPTPLISHPGESLPRGVLKSELPFALTDAVFLYDTWGVELGTVKPGQVIDLEQLRSRVASAATTITGKRVKPTEAAQNYDRSNTDVSQILKLLLLHRAAGGTRYTGLYSRAWPLLDQSSSLTENQALILGRGPAPVKWKIGDAGELLQPLEPASDVCWYRLWLPVVSNEQATLSASAPTAVGLPEKK